MPAVTFTVLLRHAYEAYRAGGGKLLIAAFTLFEDQLTQLYRKLRIAFNKG